MDAKITTSVLDSNVPVIVDGNYIDSVITGLKNLYEELVTEDQDNETRKTFNEVWTITCLMLEQLF